MARSTLPSSTEIERRALKWVDMVIAFGIGALLGALAQAHNQAEEPGLMVPPPDTLHQRVIDRCVSCHLTEGGPLR